MASSWQARFNPTSSRFWRDPKLVVVSWLMVFY
jgi:hypothetical protein